MKKLRSFLAYFFIYSLLIGTILVSIAIILGIVYEKEIKKATVNFISKNFNGSIVIKDIEFSFIQNFPKATIIIYDISAKLNNNQKFPKKDLLAAGEIRVKLNPIDFLLHKKYIIEEIILKNSILNLVEHKGKFNYEEFLNLKNTKDKNSDFKLTLKKVELSHSNLHIKVKNIRIDVKDCNLFFTGNFNPKKLAVNTLINWQKFSMFPEKGFHLNLPTSSLKTKFRYNITKEIYDIPEFNLKVKTISLLGKGYYNNSNNNIDIKLKTENTNLEQLLSLIPKKLTAEANYKAKGQADIFLGIQGKLSSKKLPALKFLTKIKDGFLQIADTIEPLQKINAQANLLWDLSNSDKAYLKIRPLKFVWKNIPVLADLRINNFKNPKIYTQAKGEISNNILNMFLPDSSTTITGGSTKFNLLIEAPLEALKYNRFSKFRKFSGNVKISRAQIQHTNLPYPILINTASILLNKGNLLLKNTDLLINGNKFKLNGSLSNVFSGNIKLIAEVYTDFLDLDKFIYSNYRASSSGGTAINYYIKLDLHSKRLKLSPLRATSVNISLKLTPSGIIFNRALLKAFDGSISLTNGKYYKDKIKFSYDLNNIRIEKFFAAYKELAEYTDVGKYISGIISGQGNVEFLYKDSIIYNSILSEGTIETHELKIKDYKPLYEFSKFVKIKSLQNAVFEDMTINYKIENSRIYVQRFEVKVNEFRLFVEGYQTFDGELNYTVQIFFPNWSLFKKKQKELNIIEEENNTKLNPSLFVRILGTTENPKFIIAKKALKNKIQQDIQKEKQELKEAQEKTDEELFGKQDTTTTETLIEEEKKQNLKLPKFLRKNKR